MRKILRIVLTGIAAFLLSVGVMWAQTGSITGMVTNEEGESVPTANVLLVEIERGAATNLNGEYTIDNVEPGTYTLRVTFVGYQDYTTQVTIEAGQALTKSVTLQRGAVGLQKLVVTALGQTVTKRSATFATATVGSDELTVAPNSNVKTALAGKVAGVSFRGQAGSKLGSYGDVRIRGEVSLTNASSDPLYIVDGVPVREPSMIDMSNIAEVSVLKGANAAALYGQRGENGVIIMTTKQARPGDVSVSVNSSVLIQQVSNLPRYQNKYGQGYSGESEWATFNYDPAIHPAYFKPMDGMRYISSSHADASWGPKFDGKPYAAWFTWWPDSPYYGQAVAYKAHPNTVQNFYDVGVKVKNGITVSTYQEGFLARLSYSNLQQGGLVPTTELDKHFLSGSFSYDVTDDLKVQADINYTVANINGQFNDGYGNQVSGSFSQWYGRNLSTKKMKELAQLQTPEGYYASWNWWGPQRYSKNGLGKGLKGYLKPTFWFNSYTWVQEYARIRDNENMLIHFKATYQLSDQFELVGAVSRYREDDSGEFYLPYSLEESSSINLYNKFVNSFGVRKRHYQEDNYSARLNYVANYDEWSFDAFVGGNIRIDERSFFSVSMNQNNMISGGLIIPNVYKFSNSKQVLIPTETAKQKRVYSLYSKLNVGYEDFLFVNATYRQDWSSALPEENNGYGYPSLGASFVFSEFINSDILSYGKVRASWAQVGDDVGSERIIGGYGLISISYTHPFTGGEVPILYAPNLKIDPNIKPALNTSYEFGTDMRFFNNRIGLSATYYHVKREDEIISIPVSSATGFFSILTNAGTTEARGIELALDGYVLRSNDFQWNMKLTFAKHTTTIKSLPGGQETYVMDLADDSDYGFVFVTHRIGQHWGQLRGTGIARNDEGQPIINEQGLYVLDQNMFFGSILPDFNGGVLNTVSYKNFRFSFSIDFQKGGKFFSLSEMWGSHTGLMYNTANRNDKGNLKRTPVSEGGGVHVTGVTPNGDPVDKYIPAKTYYQQFFSNRLAEPFVHDASYIKLRAVNLSYTLPANLFGGRIKSATIGVVARNLLMIYTNNPHGWDPSQFAEVYGENAQLPGTRSIGFNLNITF